jgi:hypothetical protein
MAALHRARQGLEPDVIGAAVAAEAMNFTSLSIFPCFFNERYMVSTPDMVAAAFSNAVWIQGILQAVYSEIQVETSRHPVALAAITG